MKTVKLRLRFLIKKKFSELKLFWVILGFFLKKLTFQKKITLLKTVIKLQKIENKSA